MTTKTQRKPKTNTFLLSQQVKAILQKSGLSKVFNYEDYTHFKNAAKNAFNKPLAIAQMFMEEANEQSDFNEYIF